MSIRIGLMGYGNLSRGVEAAIKQSDDLELVAVFTRRDPSSVKVKTEGVPVLSEGEIEAWTDKIDVLVLGGGSATDLPGQTPKYAKLFNVVDSFDTHARIPEHFANVDAAAKESGKLGVISIGWDPGLFSLMRMLSTAVLPVGKNYTFWGRGVSQGHSDARQKHTRECFVVAKEGADLARIEKEIKEMPNYFDEYDTTVNFISQEELDKNHKGLPHGGFVIRSGETGEGTKHIVEFNLKLESNPEFTGAVIAAYARAAFRLNNEGATGCKTIFDIPVSYLSALSGEELRKTLL